MDEFVLTCNGSLSPLLPVLSFYIFHSEDPKFRSFVFSSNEPICPGHTAEPISFFWKQISFVPFFGRIGRGVWTSCLCVDFGPRNRQSYLTVVWNCVVAEHLRFMDISMCVTSSSKRKWSGLLIAKFQQLDFQ